MLHVHYMTAIPWHSISSTGLSMNRSMLRSHSGHDTSARPAPGSKFELIHFTKSKLPSLDGTPLQGVSYGPLLGDHFKDRFPDRKPHHQATRDNIFTEYHRLADDNASIRPEDNCLCSASCNAMMACTLLVDN